MKKIIVSFLILIPILFSACGFGSESVETSFMRTVVSKAIEGDLKAVKSYYLNWKYLNNIHAARDAGATPEQLDSLNLEYMDQVESFVEYLTILFNSSRLSDYSFSKSSTRDWVDVKISKNGEYLTKFKVFQFKDVWYFSD